MISAGAIPSHPSTKVARVRLSHRADCPSTPNRHGVATGHTAVASRVSSWAHRPQTSSPRPSWRAREPRRWCAASRLSRAARTCTAASASSARRISPCRRCAFAPVRWSSRGWAPSTARICTGCCTMHCAPSRRNWGSRPTPGASSPPAPPCPHRTSYSVGLPCISNLRKRPLRLGPQHQRASGCCLRSFSRTRTARSPSWSLSCRPRVGSTCSMRWCSRVSCLLKGSV
mmetsp:Transcript_8403/g.16888  ORF Transcript_8403/g.16888 Transcript_8403/m.16888 type:complete len:229 (+) Transcript_8403:674-1360(+)